MAILRESTLLQSIRRVRTHLPAVDDYLLIVLKGDLLIEEQLRRIVRGAVEAPEELGKSPNFRLLYNLARALRRSHARPEIWDTASQLHEKRNTYAHRLEHDLTAAAVDEWSLERIKAYQAVEVAADYMDAATMERTERLRLVILVTYVGLRTIDNPDLTDTGPEWRDGAPAGAQPKKRRKTG